MSENNNSQFKRSAKYGVLLAVRNPFVSFSVLFTMSITLFVVGMSFVSWYILNTAIENVNSKIDTSVYFRVGTEEAAILDLKSDIETLPYIREVMYVSAEAALEEYKDRHRNDPELLEGLSILDTNPLRARLSIGVWNIDRLENVSKFVENADILSDNPSVIVDKIDFYQNRKVIERLSSIISTANTVSGVLMSLFLFLSFLIVFNTVRITIYLSKEEIEVMKLMGASDSYIRAPFLINAALLGMLSSILAVLFLFPAIVFVAPFVGEILNVENTFLDYAFLLSILLAALMPIGILIATVSSWLSTSRYIDK